MLWRQIEYLYVVSNCRLSFNLHLWFKQMIIVGLIHDVFMYLHWWLQTWSSINMLVFMLEGFYLFQKYNKPKPCRLDICICICYCMSCLSHITSSKCPSKWYMEGVNVFLFQHQSINWILSFGKRVGGMVIILNIC